MKKRTKVNAGVLNLDKTVKDLNRQVKAVLPILEAAVVWQKHRDSQPEIFNGPKAEEKWTDTEFHLKHNLLELIRALGKNGTD